MKEYIQDNTSDYVGKQFVIHRANKLLQYGWIKMLLGSFVILFFAFTDIYVKHNYISAYFRLLPVFFSFLFIILSFLVFKRNKSLVLGFYNMFYLSLVIMMYGIMINDIGTTFFTQSTEGMLLILAVASVELQGNFRSIVIFYLVPFVGMLIIYFFVGKLLAVEKMMILHQLTFMFFGILYCVIKEKMNFESFKTQLNLENEKRKTDDLVKTLTEHAEEINSQKEEISVQRDQSETQRLLLERQRQEQHSNLTYASRIQQSLLPSNEIMKKNFEDYFIIIKPRDIVSGDFYWSARAGDWTYFAVADCTGHGVSAAFMSILGITFLNETIREFEGLTPGLILNRLRNLIVDTLHQTSDTLDNQDGMDIALCAFNRTTNRLVFAGANSSMLLIRNNAFIPEIKYVKGDKMPVSVYLRMDSFTNTEFQIQAGDQLYLFSDGYADQFGGPKGKKFKMSPFKALIIQGSSQSMREQKKTLTNNIENWINQPHHRYEQTDDIMVLGVKFSASTSSNL